MKQDTLQKVLACKSLPSLPAVALRVIEQTSDPNLKLAELAVTIQNDQGLTAKVLKTVNSSFYGLRSPCSTINRALVLMGLAPVKTLVLGFSLVNAINDSKSDQGFDYISYWRRGLYTAVASKAIAESAGKPWGDEAFLSGLLQDIGVVAMLSALGDEYANLVADAGNHRLLAGAESEYFEVTHGEVGAMLAQRWKLPTDLIIPLRYHDHPTAAPVEYADRCRCVALGNLIHDVLTDSDPKAAMANLSRRADQWFSLDASSVDQLIRRCSEGAKELSRLFRLDTGPFASVDDVLATALALQTEAEGTARPDDGGDPLAELLKNGEGYDPLTGAYTRDAFSALVRDAVAGRGSPGKPPMLLQVGIDPPTARAFLSQDAMDERVTRVANVLMRYFPGPAASVCRLSTDLFAVVHCSASDRLMHAAIESVRRELGSLQPAIGISVGSASFGGTIATPHDLVVAATKSLQVARYVGAVAAKNSVKAA